MSDPYKSKATDKADDQPGNKIEDELISAMLDGEITPDDTQRCRLHDIQAQKKWQLYCMIRETLQNRPSESLAKRGMYSRIENQIDRVHAKNTGKRRRVAISRSNRNIGVIAIFALLITAKLSTLLWNKEKEFRK